MKARESNSEIIAAKVRPSIHAKVRAEAERRRVPVSMLVRWMLEDFAEGKPMRRKAS